MEIQIGGNWMRSPFVSAIGTMINVGSTSSSSSGAHAANSKTRPRPERERAPAASDGAISTFTRQALLQDDERHHRSQDQNGQRRACVEVDELMDVILDEVGDHHVRRRT